MFRLSFVLRLPVWLYIMLLTISIVLLLTIGNHIINRKTFINQLNQSSFVEIAETNQPIGFKNQYYFELFSMTITSEDDIVIASDRYMTMEGQVYQDHYLSYDIQAKTHFQLNSNEAAISRNIANQHRLAIGDTIFVTKSFNRHEFVITNIFGDFFGDLDLDFSKNGLIILGHTEALYNQFGQMKIISYHDEFLAHSQRFINKITLNEQVQNEYTLYYVLLTMILISIYAVTESLWAGRTNNDIAVIKQYNFSNTQVAIYGIINTFYKYLLLVLPLIIGSVILGNLYNPYWFELILYAIMMLIILMVIDGVRLNRYQKEKL